MSAWVDERGLLGRHLLSGAGNTLFGFGLIFGLMWLGVSAYVSNLIGYVGGLLFGFLVSRIFVFDAKGAISRHFLRYALSFTICVAINLFVLTLAIKHFNFHQILSQFLAAGSYTATMFLMSRFYVFKGAEHASAT